ncbi:MAG: ATP synthase subunit I [Syntrophus sp. SKADARSKE-3]|nr:ATP synthase subunit I [Syntrophus sp. SKADARSKE-3]
MNMPAVFLLVFVAGLSLGLFYFPVLWLTVRRLAGSARPVRLLALSFAARFTVALAVFYSIMDGHHGERLLIAVAGFIAAREICKRLWGMRRMGIT